MKNLSKFTGKNLWWSSFIVEDEGCSFSGFSFSFYFNLENENDRRNDLVDLILKIFTRTRIYAWSWR